MPAPHYNRNIFFRGTIVVCLLVCALLWIPERFQNTSTEKEAVSAGADSTTAVAAKETTADMVPSKAKAKVEAKANVVQDKAEADVVPEVAKVEVKAKVVQDKAKADVVPEVAKADVVVQSEAETVSAEVAEPVTPVEPIEDIEEREVIAGTTSTSTESASEAATDMTFAGEVATDTTFAGEADMDTIFAGEGSEAIFITRADSASVDTLRASADTLCVRADTSSVRVDSVCVRMDTVRALPPVVALRTNLLYDAALIPNIGIEIWLGKQFTIGADWFGTWLSWDERHLYWQGYGGYLTLRYYFGKQAKAYRFVGHHAGIYGSALTYDVEFGGKGYQAAKFGFGGGLEYGYSLRLNRSLSFDFTLGVGYQGGEYKVYQPTNDGTGHYEWLATYKRHWIGPTKAEISLKWMIAPVGKKKGGER